MLIGFEDLKSQLTKSYQGNKLHHAILLCGKRGIGKASFAKEFCSEILQSKNSDNIASNPDLLLIEKDEGKNEINAEKTRQITGFVNQTSANNKDKFIIIDAACELNKTAANALLKILEEPHANNFLILICHNLSNLLPTIRSRCQIIKINDHSFENFGKILQLQNINFNQEEKLFLAEIFDNSPAQTVNFGAETSRFYQLFLRSILNKKLNDELSKTIADKKFPFFVFIRICEFFFSRLSKNFFTTNQKQNFFFEENQVFNEMMQKFSLEKILSLQDEVMFNLRKVSPLYLDTKLSLINIFNRLSYE